jgi:UDPglucose--hexose-1-phosphate uridylyltransferase
LTTAPSTANEIRKDYLIDRWTVIATGRKKRPVDFKRAPEEKKTSGVCALEPGNEDMTPPAVLVYVRSDGGIKRDQDKDGIRHKDWLVRCVPNLFPAFTPPQTSETDVAQEFFLRNRATGHHEVLVESPVHDEHPASARISQLIHVTNASRDRLRELSQKKYVKYVSIFRNHGLEAGASLSHAHTQIIATPIIPRTIEEELKTSEQFLRKNGKCAFCEILKKEENQSRFIWKNEHFVVFAPWGSVHPFEFWIFPRKHQRSLLDLSQTEVESLAKTVRICFGALKSLLNDPPYNYGFHQLCADRCEHYHWHLEVYPKLSIWAGFEKSTGMYINVVSPEDAAAHMREATREEEKKLSTVQS